MPDPDYCGLCQRYEYHDQSGYCLGCQKISEILTREGTRPRDIVQSLILTAQALEDLVKDWNPVTTNNAFEMIAILKDRHGIE